MFISHSPYYNGAEICLLRLLKHINDDKFEPVVVLPEEGPMVDEFKKLGIKYYVTQLERWIRFKFDKPVNNSTLKSRIDKLSDIISIEQPDIIHSNTSVILEGVISARLSNIKHVWHIHEFFESHELHPVVSIDLVKEIINHLSHKVVCVSNFVQQQFDVFPQEKLLTIYNGVESNSETKNIEFRRDLGIDDNDFVFVSIGILNNNKGSEMLLDAASLVLKNTSSVKFLWVGNGTKEEVKKFNKKVKSLGIRKHVILLEQRRNIPEILKNSDAVLCTSKVETLSLTIVEGMAAGLPVITTDCGGPIECVTDGVNGYIVPVNDSVALSNKILELISNAETGKIFGQNSLSIFNEKFTIEKYTNNFEKLYENLYNTNSPEITSRESSSINSLIQFYDEISTQYWRSLK